MMTRAARRVAITGMSAICPLGNSLAALWEGMREGRCGIQPMGQSEGETVAFAYGGKATQFTGAIEDFGPLPSKRKKVVRKGLKLMCREIQMGVAAAQLALHEAAIDEQCHDPERAGVVFGCDHIVTAPEEFAEGLRACATSAEGFSVERWPLDGLAKVTPLWLLKYLPNMPASHIAICNDLRGPNNSITYREVSSNLALGEAAANIQRGWADRMVAGATGSSILPFRALQMALQTQLAPSAAGRQRACLPFDARRGGSVAGEGAAVLVVEDWDVATRRNATIYGEVLGCGSSVVLDRNSVADIRQALVNAMHAAFRAARLRPDQIGHVHAHGGGTWRGDIDEAAAIERVFGPPTTAVPVTAAKSYFGNLGAASGLVETTCSLLGVRHGRIPPILNFRHADPRCPINAVTDWQPCVNSTFLNLNYSGQGQASAVILRGVAA